MFGTIENTHVKITEKISIIKKSLDSMKLIINAIRSNLKPGKRHAENTYILDSIHINLMTNTIETIENNYFLSTVSVLNDYYESSDNEERNTRDYYRVITSENIVAKLNDIISKIKHSAETLSRIKNKDCDDLLETISKDAIRAYNIEINVVIEKINYEICKCNGKKMIVVPELSELHCSNCGKRKTIIGAVFRDDQFYPQEGQKTKHGGYDTSRHYKFWIERLQALETKTFEDYELEKIEYVLKRDGYDRKSLTCEQMREILKDPKVDATRLNDHAPLLVKRFGGPPPPLLDFQENKNTSIKFNKAMRLYDIVTPEGGNKPYYPYFIYKIIEYDFMDNPEKLRLLDYIHLQSRETVIKNDKSFEQMVAISDSDDGLFYSPTDPAGRI